MVGPRLGQTGTRPHTLTGRWLGALAPTPMMTQAAEAHFDDTFVPWSAKKGAILSKYTTSAKMAIGVVWA